MRDKNFAFATVLALIGVPYIWTTAANATTYNWTAATDDAGTPFTSSGSLDETGGVVTAISGSWDGVTISGLAATGTSQPPTNDNAFPIDTQGVAFDLASALPGGSTIVDVYNNGGATDIWNGDSTTDYTTNSFTFATTEATVPEPASLVLLGTGVLALLAAGAGRRRIAI